MIKWFFRGPFANFGYLISIKEIKGLDNIPLKGGFIVAANHSSYMDIWCLSAVFLVKRKINVRYLAKRELFKIPILGWFLKIYDPIPFDRKLEKKYALKEAINSLKKGEVMGIYPEGTRSLTGKIQKGKTGIARLVLGAKVPVVPIGIKGTRDMMPKDSFFPKFNRSAVVNIGKPIYFDKYYNKKITKQLLRKLTDEVMTEIAKLSNQRYLP